jgi:hypothetical protein
VFGGDDVDLIQFGDASGITGGTTHGDPGYIFLGAQTRAGQDAAIRCRRGLIQVVYFAGYGERHHAGQLTALTAFGRNTRRTP